MKKSKILHKKKKNKKSDSDGEVEEDVEDFESSEEELDLTKECHPIGYYIDDRTEMINQMFSVIKGNKLRAMLPPLLKSCDVDQLKLQCLDQLLGMSSKRISAIIEGEILETSSESEVVSEEQNSSDSSSSKGAASDSDSNKSLVENNRKSKSSRRKRKADSKHQSKSSKAPKLEEEEEEAPAPEQGKTLLEILELEMRARAIRALLMQNNETESGVDTKSKQNEAAGEVVDLTNCEDDEEAAPITKKDEKVPNTPTNQTPVVGSKEAVPTIKKEVIDMVESDKIDSAKSHEDKKEENGISGVPTANNMKDPDADVLKKQKLKAESELRNKLFKKKIYRTRQQRMENEEKDDNPVKSKRIENFVLENIKQEPPDLPNEIVIEDPEEGEISTDEDEIPIVIKQEKEEPQENAEKPVEIQEEKMEGVEFISSYPSEEPDKPVYHTVEMLPEPETAENVSDINSQESDILPKNNEEQTAEESQEETVSENKDVEVSDSRDTEKKEDPVDDIPEHCSWFSRWVQKDDVQKVVKSSKIFSKVKKKLKQADKNLKFKEDSNLVPEEVNSDSNSIPPPNFDVIEGSVQEYEKLPSKTGEEVEVQEHALSTVQTEEKNEIAKMDNDNKMEC